MCNQLFTTLVYYFRTETKNEEKIPGGWSDWSSWTACSAKCNGGMRSRERVCNNPEPQNGGANCEGEAEDAEGCNEEACEPGNNMLRYVNVSIETRLVENQHDVFIFLFLLSYFYL